MAPLVSALFISQKGDGTMRTIQEQLIGKKFSDSRIQETEHLSTNTSFKSKEHLTRKDWEELMGLNRPTYQKQGGTVRRKR